MRPVEIGDDDTNDVHVLDGLEEGKLVLTDQPIPETEGYSVGM